MEVVWDGRELDWVEPRGCREYLRGVGMKYLVNPIFEEAFRRILEAYKPRRRYAIGLILPCSYGKPYSQSYIHYLIRRAIGDLVAEGLVHEIIVTNAGVVPRELDEYWPYCAYDWNPAYETPEIKEAYTRVLAERLTRYITRFRDYYKAFAAYLRWDSESWQAVQQASKRLGIIIPNLAPEQVPEQELSEASINGLYKDQDLVLVTPTATRTLRTRLLQLIKNHS